MNLFNPTIIYPLQNYYRLHYLMSTKCLHKTQLDDFQYIKHTQFPESLKTTENSLQNSKKSKKGLTILKPSPF